jgi:hypothetical protein
MLNYTTRNLVVDSSVSDRLTSLGILSYFSFNHGGSISYEWPQWICLIKPFDLAEMQHKTRCEYLVLEWNLSYRALI